MIDEIKFTLKNRKLTASGAMFSGETVKIIVSIDDSTLSAENYKLLVYGNNKNALALSNSFTAQAEAGTWETTISTCTEEVAEIFEEVAANLIKTFGVAIINDSTSDIIALGLLDMVSSPMPNDLVPIPQVLHFITDEELEALLTDYETKAELETTLSSYETKAELDEILSGYTTSSQTQVVMEAAMNAQGMANVAQDLAGQAMGSAIAAESAAETAQQTADEAVAGLAAKADALHTHVAADISSGTLNAARLPIATTSALGGIKVGANLSISDDGTLSASGGGGGGNGFNFVFAGELLERDFSLTLYFADNTSQTYTPPPNTGNLNITENNVVGYMIKNTVPLSVTMIPSNDTTSGYSTKSINGKTYIFGGNYINTTHATSWGLSVGNVYSIMIDTMLIWEGDR